MTKPEILIGTSAFTAEGWVGSFYPEGMQPRDFLSYYATPDFQTSRSKPICRAGVGE